MREEDFAYSNDSDRQKYLNDLERLRRIKENEQLENRNKSVSDYIEDYYYDADGKQPSASMGDGYDDYEGFLLGRSSSASQSRIAEDVFESSYRRRNRPTSDANHAKDSVPKRDPIQNMNFQNGASGKLNANSKRDAYLNAKKMEKETRAASAAMQSGLRLPELDGNLDKKRQAIHQADEMAMKKKRLEEAAIQEQMRRDAELASRRRAGQARKSSEYPTSRAETSDESGSETRRNRNIQNMKNRRLAQSSVSRQAPSSKSGRSNISKNGMQKSGVSKKEKDKTPVPFGKRVKKFFGNLVKVAVLTCIFLGFFLAYSFYTKQEGYYTVAIFGVDSRDGNVGKGALADVNMIANINRETGAIQLVSVYRDMISEIDGEGTYHKLNEAYFRGGPSKGVAALERNLDLDIEGYATFNWKAVVDGINILGGIDLEITEPEFKYINGYITSVVDATGVGSVHLEHAGMNHLDGVQAVAYARLRLMDTDYNRTERQRKVVKLAMDKAKNADFATLNNVMVTVLPQISTNMTIDDLIPFAKDIKKYYLSETAGFPFELQTKDIGKRDYVVPVTLKSNVVKLHSFLYGNGDNVSYTPSAKLKEISQHIIAASGLGDDGEDIEIKIDKGGEGGIGPKGGGSSIKASDTPQTEPPSQAPTEAESQTTAETTVEVTTEEMIAPSDHTLAPESTIALQDQGDNNAQDQTAAQNLGINALTDDAENGPGVNP